MTTPSAVRPQPVVSVAVRTVSGTAWQMLATIGFMIMIGLVGCVWFPWLTEMVNRAAV